MKTLTATKILSSVALFSLLFLPRILFAQSGGDLTFANPLTSIDTLPEFINALLTIVIQIAIPVIVVMIIYAGFLFVTARGDTTKLQTARTTFIWTVVGAAIILGAKVFAAGIAGTIEALAF